jgi:hypothetical protein
MRASEPKEMGGVWNMRRRPFERLLVVFFALLSAAPTFGPDEG